MFCTASTHRPAAATATTLEPTDRKTASDQASQSASALPAEDLSGSSLSALTAIPFTPITPITEIRHLPPEIQLKVTAYFKPREIVRYADAFDPPLVPTPERHAAALLLRIGAADSFDQLEACLNDAIDLPRSVRFRPMQEALNRLQDEGRRMISRGDGERVEALLGRCQEAAQELRHDRAARIASACRHLRLAMTTRQDVDAVHLAALVHEEVPALLGRDRAYALRDALRFVDRRIGAGAPWHQTRGERLDAVVHACLEQADFLPSEERAGLIRQATALASAWQDRGHSVWNEVDALLMERLDRLPLTSLHQHVSHIGNVFVERVASMLGQLPIQDRAAFVDPLIASLPAAAFHRGEACASIAALLPLLPPADITERFMKIAQAIGKPRGYSGDWESALNTLSSRPVFDAVAPQQKAAALELLAKKAQAVRWEPSECRAFLNRLGGRIAMAPDAQQDALREMLEQAWRSTT